MKYYAHSNDNLDSSGWHLLKDHLEDTAKLASDFAKAFNADQLGYIAGLLHDVGKYSPDFQKRLQGEKTKVDHSTAGALVALQSHKTFGKLLSYIIAGHHCGLTDWGSEVDESSMVGRVNKKSIPDYSAYKEEIYLPDMSKLSFPIKSSPSGLGFSVQFFIRFLYSALVDADFIDTESVLNVEKASLRGGKTDFCEMLSKLDAHLADMDTSASQTFINRQRKEILSNCREKASIAPGLFTLTVPTGGGKTLSSMAFALKHLLAHSMERIIYVIPYTSIIEQNAAVFKKILGEEVVLEHHSNFNYPEDDMRETELEYNSQTLAKIKLASENWNVPIITTTNVQFFESLFAAKSSRCRKLHNIANSIIIIDEAQMIPTGYLRPCVNALLELVANYKASVILCTATQPAINSFIPSDLKPVEIMDSPLKLYNVFQRVEVKDLGPLTDDSLSELILRHKQVLCIVNSKKHARLLFEKISNKKDENSVFHLSTRMCPVHRSQILEEVRESLKRGDACRLVSTQLVEAGVDLDFPFVYRSMAGIDSIAQAAGRCNRHGLSDKGQVYVFRPEKHGLPAGWLSRTASIGEEIFKKNEDPLSLDAIKDYFAMLYAIEAEKLDKEKIMQLIQEQESSLSFPFRIIASKVKLIDENTTSVIIPWENSCKELLQQAAWSDRPGRFSRRLQKYSVQVFESEFKEMLSFGIIESVAENFYVLRDDVVQLHYSKEMGLMPCTESMFLNDNL
ncbi:MAG: CRISPR-associated helicase Cas3', partial [Candidatus Syntrophonatronum acetioxidans]